jgi:hypothetical protein
LTRKIAVLAKIMGGTIAALLLLYLVLLIPAPDTTPPSAGDDIPFIWDQDDYWTYLESVFLKAKKMDPTVLADSIESGILKAETLIDSCANTAVAPSSPLLDDIEKTFFELSPFMAAQTDRISELIGLRNRLRAAIKSRSRNWDMTSSETRNRLYRLLFGTRTAVEEVILQSKNPISSSMIWANDEPSVTPSAELLGTTIHSGDILVSRGGAPTSALIARGNDYPGNFSHVALVYVDQNDGKMSIIESHIERGVAIASPEEYLRDTKLRILFLRLSADNAQIIADPMLPHRAASLAFQRVQQEHIPYDFEMDFNDNSRLFCSEVASDPYSQLGVTLWMGISHISSPGIRSWLAAFGVKHFETQEPSDLEYDPQLTVVAEWYNPESLYKDHLDNAVIDAMLEGAEAGERLDYDRYMLPVARVLKAYSVFKNLWGGIGPIPEGMDAAAALKNDHFSKRHTAIKHRLKILAEDFERSRGYRPPYWELVKLARVAKAEVDSR